MFARLNRVDFVLRIVEVLVFTPLIAILVAVALQAGAGR